MLKIIITLFFTTYLLSCSEHDSKRNSLSIAQIESKTSKVCELIGNMGRNHHDTLKYEKALNLLNDISEVDSCNGNIFQLKFVSLLYLGRHEELLTTIELLKCDFNTYGLNILKAFVLLEMNDDVNANIMLDSLIAETKTEYNKNTNVKAYLELYLIALKLKGDDEKTMQTLDFLKDNGEIDTYHYTSILRKLRYPRRGTILLSFLEMILFPNKVIDN